MQGDTEMINSHNQVLTVAPRIFIVADHLVLAISVF